MLQEKTTIDIPDSNTANSVVKEGDFILIKSCKLSKVFQVSTSRQIRFEKSKFNVGSIIGETYGSQFEVKSGKLLKLQNVANEADTEIFEEDEIEKDNRNLTDTAENQKLNKADINALRKEGASGHEIIEQLVENSSTFKAKTEFAQEKYIKKKKKKHVSSFSILKPNTRLLAQMYYDKGPTKFLNLRYDSIAQILCHGNVQAGNKVVVLESVCGLLVGAILERLANTGTLIQLYAGSAPSREALEYFQFSSSVKKRLLSFPLKEVNTLNRKKPEVVSVEKSHTHMVQNDAGNIAQKIVMDLSEVSKSEKDESRDDSDSINVDNKGDLNKDKLQSNSNSENITGSQPKVSLRQKRKADVDWDAIKEQRKKFRLNENAESKSILEECKVDGLIIASKFHPTPIVMSLIDYLAPSRPIVVFCQYKEPLMDCFVKLRSRGGVLNLRLAETWLRNYQILPNRTHPEINMSGTGGYLLTGTVVYKESS